MSSTSNLNKFIVGFIVFITLVSLWTLNAAPSFHFPLFPELICICLSMICFGIYRNFPTDRFVKFAFFLLLTIVIVNGIRTLFETYQLEKQTALCSVAFGFFQKLECFAQSGVELNAAPRQWLYSFCALCVAVSGFNLKAFRLNRIFIYVGLIFVTASYFLTTTQLAQSQHWLGNGYSGERFSSLMENPTWIWPYLIPSLISCFIELETSKSKFFQTLAGFSIVCLSLFMIATQQRGATLLSLISLIGLVIWFVTRFKKSQQIKFFYVPTTFLIVLVSIFLSNKIIATVRSAMNVLGVGSRVIDVEFTATSRIKMWEVAWNSMDGHWLAGFGYASWFKEFTTFATVAKSDAFDTAHNFFVQTLFEDGVIGILAVSLVFIFLAFNFLMSTRYRNKYKFSFLILLIAYGLALSVQEINFIRSTYFSNSLFLGWFVASTSASNSFKNNQIKYFLIPLAILGMVFSLAISQAFSLGGYQYEANFKSGYDPKVRWLKPSGTLAFTKLWKVEKDKFALYRVLKSNASSFEWTDSKEVIDLSRTEGETFIPVVEKSFFSPARFYSINSSVFEISRFLSVMVSWPPILTSLPLTYSTGLYDWENSSLTTGQVRWCGISCKLEFKSCDSKDEMRFIEVIAARPDLSENNSLDAEFIGSQETALHSFKNPNESKWLSASGNKLTINVSRAFQSLEDQRAKGLLILGSKCSKSESKL